MCTPRKYVGRRGTRSRYPRALSQPRYQWAILAYIYPCLDPWEALQEPCRCPGGARPINLTLYGPRSGPVRYTYGHWPARLTDYQMKTSSWFCIYTCNNARPVTFLGLLICILRIWWNMPENIFWSKVGVLGTSFLKRPLSCTNAHCSFSIRLTHEGTKRTPWNKATIWAL